MANKLHVYSPVLRNKFPELYIELNELKVFFVIHFIIFTFKYVIGVSVK